MPKRTETSHQQTGRRTKKDVRFGNATLIAAFEALPAGFSPYDADDRLVRFNLRYREFYPKHADALVVGKRFEDLSRAVDQNVAS